MDLPYTEVIVVDDGSTDPTKDIVDLFPGLARYVWQENSGPGAARNAGIRESSGDLIRFIDHDDYVLSHDGLIDQVRILESHEDVGLVFSQALYVDERGRPLTVRGSTHRSNYVRPGSYELRELMLYNYIPTSSTIVRKSVLDKVGGFRTDLPTAQDWELWMRIARASSIGYVASPVVAYRVHGAGITGKKTLGMWLTVHKQILGELFDDDDFARRFGELRPLAYNNLDARAAGAAYLVGDTAATRAYASRALGTALAAGRWPIAFEASRIFAKALVPNTVRRRLHPISRECRIVATRARLALGAGSSRARAT
jgi:hypothetical protein